MSPGVIDLVALAMVAWVAAMGWRRGIRAMLLWGLSGVAGSLAATFLARPAGSLVASNTRLSPIVAYVVAGFAVVALATTVARRALRRAEGERSLLMESGWRPPTSDRVGGAAVGVGMGACIALFLAWVAGSLGDLHHHEEELHASMVGQAAGQLGEPVVRALAGRATGDIVMASTVAYVMSDPEEARATLRALVADPRVTGLVGDTLFRSELADGRVADLAASPSLRSLAADTLFVHAARRVRLLDDQGAPTVSADELAAAVTHRFGPLVRTLREVARDPEVVKLVHDSRVREALREGRVNALLGDPRVAQVMGRISEKLKQAQHP